MARRPSPSRFPPQRAVLTVVILVFGALAGALLFGSRGLVHLWELKVEDAAVRGRITRLLHENERLHTRLERLRTDDRYLERLARERLGLVRPGEIVYRFPPPGTTPPH